MKRRERKKEQEWTRRKNKKEEKNNEETEEETIIEEQEKAAQEKKEDNQRRRNKNNKKNINKERNKSWDEQHQRQQTKHFNLSPNGLFQGKMGEICLWGADKEGPGEKHKGPKSKETINPSKNPKPKIMRLGEIFCCPPYASSSSSLLSLSLSIAFFSLFLSFFSVSLSLSLLLALSLRGLQNTQKHRQMPKMPDWKK